MNGGVSKRWSARPALVAGLSLSALLALAPLPARAQPAPSAEVKAGARAAAEQGSDEYKAGHYDKALDLFTRAESLIHAPTHVLMLARTQVALGRLVAAQDGYRRLAREELSPRAPAAFKKAREAAEAELRELEPRIPQVNVTVSGPAPANLAVFMDGRLIPPALVGLLHPVDPGAHVLRATAEGLASPDRTITLKEGQKLAVELVLAPAAAAAPLALSPLAPTPIAASEPSAPDAPPEGKRNGARIAAFSMLGVGVVGIGVGTAFAILFAEKRGQATSLFDKCGAGCTGPTADQVRALDDSANSKGTAAVVGLVAGGALAIGGAVTLVLSRNKSAPTAAAITPWIGAGSAGLAGRF